MIITIYIKAINLEEVVDFYCKIFELFELHEEDAEENNAILINKQDRSIRLKIIQERKIVKTIIDNHYLFALEVENSELLFKKLKEKTKELSYGIFKDFFGEFLSTPISNQFTLVDPAGNKILVYENFKTTT